MLWTTKGPEGLSWQNVASTFLALEWRQEVNLLFFLRPQRALLPSEASERPCKAGRMGIRPGIRPVPRRGGSPSAPTMPASTAATSSLLGMKHHKS